MWKFDDEDFGEPTDKELVGIEKERVDYGNLDISCPRCKYEFNLLNVRFVASDPQCPRCGHICGGEY